MAQLTIDFNSLPKWILDCLVTDCATVEEFANRYYKADRFSQRGEDYVEAVIQSKRKDIAQKGYTCISHHDNVTGKFIAFAPNN